MPFKLNPITGNLDYYETGGTSHDPATVVDTTSLNLSITGQEISGAVNFGTGAGVAAEGNHAHAGVYEPADATIVKTGNASWVDLTDGGATTLHSHAGGGALPVADTQTIVSGSADATKLLRIEVDGFTTGTTRVITPPDADILLAGQNYANSFTLINPITTIAESWIGPSTTTGVYFKSSLVGLGTSSPTEKLTVVSLDNTDTTTIASFNSLNLTRGVGIRYDSIVGLGTNQNLNFTAPGSGSMLFTAVTISFTANATKFGGGLWYSSGNSMNGQYDTNANGILYFNYYGYVGGNTQFRDTQISDGKAGNIVFVDGSSGFTGFGNLSTPAATLHTRYTPATTNAIIEVERIEAASSGTVANGFGAGKAFYAETATDGTYQQQGLISTSWIDATNATRKAKLSLSAHDTAARLGLEIEASGTAAKLGFFGGTTAIQQVLNAYTSDAESGAYTGIDNAQAGTVYATVADLNALRTAYETLRASYDDLRTKLQTSTLVA